MFLARANEMNGKEKVHDLVTLGSDHTGLSAGTNAARSDLRTLILEAEEFWDQGRARVIFLGGESYPPIQ